MAAPTALRVRGGECHEQASHDQGQLEGESLHDSIDGVSRPGLPSKIASYVEKTGTVKKKHNPVEGAHLPGITIDWRGDSSPLLHTMAAGKKLGGKAPTIVSNSPEAFWRIRAKSVPSFVRRRVVGT